MEENANHAHAELETGESSNALSPLQRHSMDADGFGDAMGNNGGGRSMPPMQLQEVPEGEGQVQGEGPAQEQAEGGVTLPPDGEIGDLRETYQDNAILDGFVTAYALGGHPGLRTAIQNAQDQVAGLGDRFFTFLSDTNYWDFFRDEIVRIAQEEYDNWENEDGGRVQETQNPGPEAGWTRVVDYWQGGSNTNWIDTPAEVGSNNNPWSATFISWVLNQAGHFGAFAEGANHSNFFEPALENRQENTANPFRVYGPQEIRPQLGDLAIRNRGTSNMTLETLEGGMPSHSDIITEIDLETGTVTLIGGNVGQSVNTTTVQLDGDGFMTGTPYFAIMRMGSPDFETNDNAEALLTVEVISDTLNIRETPFVLSNSATNADENNINKVGQLAVGDQREVFEERDGWYRIGDDQWISAGEQFVQSVVDPSTEAPN